QKERKAADKKERERDLARIRKQRQREREKAADDSADGNAAMPDANTVLMQGADVLAHSTVIPDVADLSRPDTQGWKKYRKGTQGGAVQGRAKKVFWFTPFLWAIIEPTIRRCGWSAAATANALQLAHPALFNSLHRATIWKW
ncbi:hypothetical protein DFH06DRAFT_940138, partial [Mycena polygramma]